MSTDPRETGDEVTLQDYGRTVWAGRRIILVAIVAAAAVGLALTFIRTTTYSANSQVFLGQATTISGTPISTPQTNPAIAPAVLEGDAIVDPVAEEAGISPGRVRSGISLDVPRAPGSAGNLPTLAKITFRDRDRDLAQQVANLYAEQVRDYNAATFSEEEETYERQLERASAEEARLSVQEQQLRNQLVRSAGGSSEAAVQTALVLVSDRLSETLTRIENSELALANLREVGRPAIVTTAGSPSSSSSGPRRVRTVLFSAVLGAVVGLIVVFIWRRPRPEGA
ncbi:MAG: Wzz/FepE/Etk N-terminal domain-containing protein [Thermoleophilia bacterium]|nr:Wzz/FepE/Etk N-terminal domain-containing protein [Thermoleophilia bacterium]MDH3725076.1 Wzz/FepE/Etk N-terminal domain-containing protein [Thermoleophilia bacterium]